MKYIDADLLRKEIERRKMEWEALIEKDNAVNPECVKEIIYEDMNILSFLDTLSEEPVCLDDGGAPSKQKCRDCTIACSVRVEEEPDKDLEEAAEEYATTHLRNNEFPTADRAFIAGAKWQAEQDDRDVVFWKGMQYAIEGMKKDAVEGFAYPCLTPQGEAKIGVTSGALPKEMNIKAGDIVKLIIIKDDGKSD